MNVFSRRGACPALSAPMQTGDGLLVRLNPVAGGLSPKSLIGLCESAQRHGNGIMEVTARGSIQIRGLTLSSARLLAKEIDALGISVRTGVPVETGPLAGLDPEEVADPRPLAEAIRTAIDNAGLASRLGPKVSVVVDGGGLIGMDEILADVRLIAVKQDSETVWHLEIGDTAATAWSLGPFTEAGACETALTALEAIAALGREGRGRDLRGHLKQIADKHKNLHSAPPPSVLPDLSPSKGEIGLAARPSSVSNVASDGTPSKLPISPLEGEMPGRAEGGGKERGAAASPEAKSVTRDGGDGAARGFDQSSPVSHSTRLRHPALEGKAALDIISLCDSTHALAIALPFGSMPAECMAGLAQEAMNLGASEIRPAPGRALLVLGLTVAACRQLQGTAASLGFVTDPADPRTHIAACPGAPACTSGRIATREIAESFAAGSGDILDGSFILHVSGCAKGCAHPGTAALTLVGGENGAGLVVDGTAKTSPSGYRPVPGAARGLDRVAALIRQARHPNESGAACLARQGSARIAAAFTQE